VGLQKTIQLIARLETKQPPEFSPGDTAGFVFFQAKPSSARRDKSSPSALRRLARSSGMGTVTFMALFPAYAGSPARYASISRSA
jgi:hypothetical protein